MTTGRAARVRNGPASQALALPKTERKKKKKPPTPAAEESPPAKDDRWFSFFRY